MHATDWLSKRAQLSPTRTALIREHDGARLDYASWNRQTNQLAHFLSTELNVQKGDRVAILATNSIPYLDTWFACSKLGAILQNLNWRLAPNELHKLIDDAAPKAVFYSEAFVETITTLQRQCPQIERWVAIDAKAREQDISLSARDAFSTSFVPDVPVSLDDPWLLCYTGGTTGLPKGAILTHRSMLFNALNTITSWQLDADDMAILNAPLFHVGGLAVFTAPLVYLGGTSILCESFDPSQVFSLIQEYPVSLFFGVPTMFIMMQEHPQWDDADFSRLKFVISGGAPCPSPVFHKFWAKGVSFKTGYGLTEAGPNNFWLPHTDIQRKPGAVGFPLMHIDAKVVDEQGDTLPPNQVGELLLRGPHVMDGYWKRPEETAKALRDGWLHTGDLAQVDEEGHFSIVGRLKEMFISGGENVYPTEIESALHEHQDVAEAAVVGVPDPKWGEVGLAVVRLLPDASLSPEDLKQHCKSILASYKVPRTFLIVDELPQTGPGKIDKRAILRQFQS